MSFALHTIPLTQKLAKVFDEMDTNARFKGSPRGTVRGVVSNVDDPEERGRVRVIFDAMNGKDIPQVEGSGAEYVRARIASGADESHWIDTSPAFKGKQPPGLVGKRVNIVATNGQYQYAILQDVVYDPQVLTTDSASKLKIPDNSSMTRLPCYPSGQLPPASVENTGCIVVEVGGPGGDDWLMVCLKRGGSYMWVRHIDRLHYHTGQLNDNDTEGNGPDKESRTYDSTVPTTGSPKEGSN